MAAEYRWNCSCGAVLLLPRRWLGRKLECPDCGYQSLVPSWSEIRAMQVIRDQQQQDRACLPLGRGHF